MKVLELTIYATTWPYIEFILYTIFEDGNDPDIWTFAEFLWLYSDRCTEKPDRVDQNELLQWQLNSIDNYFWRTAERTIVCLRFNRPNQPLQSTSNDQLKPVLTTGPVNTGTSIQPILPTLLYSYMINTRESIWLLHGKVYIYRGICSESTE